MTCKHNWHFKAPELLVCERCGTAASANAQPFYTIPEMNQILDPRRLETRQEFLARKQKEANEAP